MFWWSIVHSTRTQHLFTGDGFGIVREVEIEHDPVVKDVDRVDKGINDLPLVLHVSHVTLAEFFKPEPHPLAGQDGLFQLFFQNAGVQSFFPDFQFVQPLLGGRGQDALFNGFQKVCQPLLCVPELVFQDRQPGVLLLSFRSYVEGKGLTFVPISAATMQGVRELPGLVYNRLKDIPPVPVFTPEYKKPEPKANDRAYTIQRMEAHVWSIDAPWLEYILAGSNVDDYESLQYFQRQLDESGILTELVEKGVQENDTILIGEYQFDYIF